MRFMPENIGFAKNPIPHMAYLLKRSPSAIASRLKNWLGETSKIIEDQILLDYSLPVCDFLQTDTASADLRRCCICFLCYCLRFVYTSLLDRATLPFDRDCRLSSRAFAIIQRCNRWICNASLELGNIGLINTGERRKLFLRDPCGSTAPQAWQACGAVL